MKIPISHDKFDVFEKSIFYYWVHFLDNTDAQRLIKPKLFCYLLMQNSLGLMFYFKNINKQSLFFKPFPICTKENAQEVARTFLNIPKSDKRKLIKEVKRS